MFSDSFSRIVDVNSGNPEDILLFGIMGFMLAMILTPVYTYFAYKHKWWKRQKTVALDGRQAKILHKMHAAKHQRDFPTMAGLVFILAVVIVSLLLNFDRRQTWLLIIALVGSAIVGLADDILNVVGVGGGKTGLNSRLKMLIFLIVGLLGANYFYYKLGYSELYVPFLDQFAGSSRVEVGVLMIPIFVFITVAAANAVNFTDGIDGLSGGLTAMSFGVFAVIASAQGSYGIAAFCTTIVGALLAYVWFNIPPARFLMGDVGSLALGATLGVVAMLTDSVLLLPIVGFVYVIEALSVIIQLASKKFRGKKVFLVAPIHHHFEALGWPEAKVTMRFWIVGAVFSMIGLWVAFMSGIA